MTASLAPVLVAEDDRQVRVLLTRFFNIIDAEWPVVTAADGNEAIAYLQRAVDGDAAIPRLLVLDEHMPGYTGREILRWRHEHASLVDVPVLILTGDHIASDIDVMADATFLMKPVTFEQFETAVSQLLEP